MDQRMRWVKRKAENDGEMKIRNEGGLDRVRIKMSKWT